MPSSCPPFLAADGKAGESSHSCKYIKLVLARFALASTCSPPLMSDLLSRLNQAYFPDLSPYVYTLRLPRKGHIYALAKKGGEVLRFTCSNNKIGGRLYFEVNEDVKNFWIVFSEEEWQDDIIKKAQADPDAWMQHITLEKGSPYTAEPGDADMLIEEYREKTGHLMSIRGLEGSLRNYLETEREYTTPLYPSDDPENPHLVRRWLDSDQPFLAPGKKARLEKLATIKKDARFIVALHDPMGISYDFGKLNQVSVQTKAAYNAWFEYPASIASYVSTLEKNAGKPLSASESPWKPDWQSKIYVCKARHYYNEEEVCPEPVELPPGGSATERFALRRALGKDPSTGEPVMGWWIVREVYDPENSWAPMTLRKNSMQAFLFQRKKAGEAFGKGFEIVMRSWKIWLSNSQPWGFAHPFSFYSPQSEKALANREQALAKCLNSMTATAQGRELAVADILEKQSAPVADVFWDAAKGGALEIKLTEHTAAIIHALNDALSVLYSKNEGQFKALIALYKKRLEKDTKLPSSWRVPMPAALYYVVESELSGMEKTSQAGQGGQSTSRRSAQPDALPQPTVLDHLVFSNNTMQKSANLLNAVCEPELIQLFYNMRHSAAMGDSIPTVEKFLTALAPALAHINLGVALLQWQAEPSLYNTLGLLRAGGDVLALLKHGDQLLAEARNLAKTLGLGAKALEGGWRIKMRGAVVLDVTIDSVNMVDLIRKDQVEAAVAQGSVIAAYGVTAVVLGPGAVGVAAVSAIQLIGFYAVESLKKSEAQQWVDASYWGVDYKEKHPARPIRDNYPRISYKEHYEKLTEPPNEENRHPVLDADIRAEGMEQQMLWVRRLCAPRLKAVSFSRITYLRLSSRQFLPGQSRHVIQVAVNGVPIWDTMYPESGVGYAQSSALYEARGRVAPPAEEYPEPGVGYPVPASVPAVGGRLIPPPAPSLVLVPWWPRYDSKTGELCWEAVLDNQALKAMAAPKTSIFGKESHVLTAHAVYSYNAAISCDPLGTMCEIGELFNGDKEQQADATARIKELVKEDPSYNLDPHWLRRRH